MSALCKTVLAGDIGGTKTLLQLAEICGDGRRVLLEKRFSSAAYVSLNSIVREFLTGLPPIAIQGACFGVAGPVEAGQANITNLPWQIAASSIADEFGISQVRLINDFQAVAYGVDALSGDDFCTLQAGEAFSTGVRAVIGAGTGLGEGYMVWQSGLDQYQAMPSEGSHADFAPADAIQARLLDFLAASYGHVSYERVVSGPGLVNIYTFLRDGEKMATESPALRDAMLEEDPAAAISRFALEGPDALASQALEMFVSVYGAEAGNLALKVLARGGVYLAGGIAPKILPKLREGSFLRAFAAKGRFAELMATIPVHVILNPKVGLLGAVLVASRL